MGSICNGPMGVALNGTYAKREDEGYMNDLGQTFFLFLSRPMMFVCILEAMNFQVKPKAVVTKCKSMLSLRIIEPFS